MLAKILFKKKIENVGEVRVVYYVKQKQLLYKCWQCLTFVPARD